MLEASQSKLIHFCISNATSWGTEVRNSHAVLFETPVIFQHFPWGPVAKNAWMKLWMTMTPQLGWNLKRIKFIQLCLTQYWYEATPKRTLWDLPTRLPGCQYTRGSQYWVWNGERSTASCNMHNRILCTGALYPKHLGIKSTITWKQRAAKERPGNWTEVAVLREHPTTVLVNIRYMRFPNSNIRSLDLWQILHGFPLCRGGRGGCSQLQSLGGTVPNPPHCNTRGWKNSAKPDWWD